VLGLIDDDDFAGQGFSLFCFPDSVNFAMTFDPISSFLLTRNGGWTN
jgi:hypothetical protein